ncbi:MAG TPA: hypothetical protein PKA41_15695, partial [Verrucomicrobiota bacterium]|nr:hypothetical protein [Verrucomicrobiota bacterium]
LEVWPGEGCETAVFGSLLHRLTLPRKKGGPDWPPRLSKRRKLKLYAFCKTCYAAEHGREHFVQCHERVIQLLDLWRDAGVRVEVHDEGGFWKSRSREKLAAQLGDPKRVRQIVCE